MYDAIVLSDVHLGSPTCQAKALSHFLKRLADGSLRTSRLILNGDVFDSFDFRRLRKNHWKVLSLLRKLSDQVEIIWLSGNHDGSVEILSHLLGVTVKDEYILETGRRRVLILHGHAFDDFLDAHPFLTWLSDVIYLMLQRLDRTHTFAKTAKKGSKIFLRCAHKIQQGALEYARRQGCDAVCCGHTHLPACREGAPVDYFNSGCWTEAPGTYLTVADGHIDLHQFDAWLAEEERAVA